MAGDAELSNRSGSSLFCTGGRTGAWLPPRFVGVPVCRLGVLRPDDVVAVPVFLAMPAGGTPMRRATV